jgi:hypothetical protein
MLVQQTFLGVLVQGPRITNHEWTNRQNARALGAAD